MNVDSIEFAQWCELQQIRYRKIYSDIFKSEGEITVGSEHLFPRISIAFKLGAVPETIIQTPPFRYKARTKVFIDSVESITGIRLIYVKEERIPTTFDIFKGPCPTCPQKFLISMTDLNDSQFGKLYGPVGEIKGKFGMCKFLPLKDNKKLLQKFGVVSSPFANKLAPSFMHLYFDLNYKQQTRLLKILKEGTLKYEIS